MAESFVQHSRSPSPRGRSLAAGIRLIALLCSHYAPISLSTFQAPPVTLAIVGGSVIRSPEAPVIGDGAVIVANGRIVDVGSRRNIPIPADARVVDATGQFVLAGFQNSHAHFTEPHWVGSATLPAPQLNEQLRTMLTSYGFTTVVDTASLLAETVSLRQRIETEELAGPRILTAGLALYPPNGIPYYIREDVPPELLGLLPQPSDPDQAAGIVEQNIESGANILKVFTGSWVTRGRVLPMPTDVAVAAVAEAHRRNRLVFAHASNVEGLEVALAAGVDVLAHPMDNTHGLTDDHLRRMLESGMGLIPTLTLFGGASSSDAILDQVRGYADIGGQILFGTDVGYHDTYDPALEYELMGRAGFSWKEILASLTTNPATRFNESRTRGRVMTGYVADLVVLRGDPATDVRAYADVVWTVREGKPIFSVED